MANSQALGELFLKLDHSLGYLENLEKQKMKETFISQFKKFLQQFSECLPDIQRVLNLAWYQACRPKLWLCLSQMEKALRLCGSYSMTRQTVWYLSERMQWCVTELTRTLRETSVARNDTTDSFVTLMDSATRLVQSEGTLPVAIVHDLISQAITIAKVTLPTDCKDIHFSCHKLLTENNGQTPDSFQTEILLQTLQTLEQRVNTAVLRLLLEVFSEPNKHLKKLIKLCGKAPRPRTLSDLDSMVTELDTHIERLMLVGQYTVACCECNSLGAQMRCCLASVESIDNCLVPALTAFYLEPDCRDRRALVKLLCDHWQQEVTALHIVVNLIVDSQAFTKVVEESIKELSEGSSPDRYRAVVSRGLLLHKHLTSSPDSPISHHQLKLLQKALLRCQSTLDMNPNAADADVQEIGRLVECLSEGVDEFYKQQLTTTHDSTCISNNPVNRSIRSRRIPLSTTSKTNTPSDETMRPDLLTPYLQRVRERNTTLYMRTPRKVVQSHMLEGSPSEYESLAIDVTGILENLSKLSPAVSSRVCGITHNATTSVVSLDSVSFGPSDNTNTPVVSLNSVDIGVSERLQDLQFVEDKIRLLKTSSH